MTIDTIITVGGIAAITFGAGWFHPAYGAIAGGCCLLLLVFVARFHGVAK